MSKEFLHEKGKGDNMVEELFDFFEREGVSIQVTLSSGQKPTVHAIPKDKTVSDLIYTEGDTIVEALENMKELLFGRGEHNDSTNG